MPPRVPPHNIEAEIVVLGGMMLEPEAIPDARNIIEAKDFFRPAHQLIFDALCAMADQQAPVDLVTVRDNLLRSNQLEQVGGIEYLADLVGGVPNAKNMVFYAGIVLRTAGQREIIQAARTAAMAAYEDREDPAQILGTLEGGIQAIEDRLRYDDGAVGDLAGGVENVMARLRDVAAGKPDRNPPLSTGFGPLDAELGAGLRGGELAILAGLPGSGKTALAHGIIGHICGRAGRCLLVSGEMTRDEIAKRFLQSESRVAGNKIRVARGLQEQDYDELEHAAEILLKWGLDIYGRSARPSEIIGRLRSLRAKWRRPVDLVVIDYVQLMRAENTDARLSTADRLSDILWRYKMMSQDYNVPVLALAQFNRLGERNKRPTMFDLKGSSAFEQHANVVILLHRPDRNPTMEAQVAVCVEKHRDGIGSTWESAKWLTLHTLITRFEE